MNFKVLGVPWNSEDLGEETLDYLEVLFLFELRSRV